MTDTRTGILIKKDETGKEIWIYPITSTDNILHEGNEQLDEIITELRSKQHDIQIGTTVPTSVNMDTYFMEIKESVTET